MPTLPDRDDSDALRAAERSLAIDRYAVTGLLNALEHGKKVDGRMDFRPVIDAVESSRGLDAVGAALDVARLLPGEELAVDARWLQDVKAIPPSLGSRVESVIAGSLASLVAGKAEKAFSPDAVIRLAFADGGRIAASRDVVLGRHLEPGDRPSTFPETPLDPRIPPEFLESFERFVEAGAMLDLREALGRVAIAASSAPRPREKSGAEVTGFDPDVACTANGRAKVVVRGRGFGDRRDGDAVYAGSVRLEIADDEWSDERISVWIPADFAGEYCVSVLENVGLASSEALANLQDALFELDSVIDGNFSWGHRPLAPGLFALYTPSSRCAGSNRLWVGPPRIDRLDVGGSLSPASLRGRMSRPLKVAWSVRKADRIEWRWEPTPTTRTDRLPPLSALSTRPDAGADELAATAIRKPWSARLVLRASNRCGAVEAGVDVVMAPRTAFVAVGAGSRSVFHSGVLRYTHAHHRQTFDAVAGSGLGAIAAVQASMGSDPLPLSEFWDRLAARPVEDNGYTLLYETNNALQSALAQFKQGAYRSLLQSTLDLARSIHFGVGAAPLTAIGKSTAGKSGSSLEKALLAGANKAWPYALKTIAEALKLAIKRDGVPAETVRKVEGLSTTFKVGAEFGPYSVNEQRQGVGAVQGAADPAFSAVTFVVAKIPPYGPLIAAGMAVVYQVAFAIAKELEKDDQARRFEAAMASGAIASSAGLHSSLDIWLGAIGLNPAGVRTLGTAVRLPVAVLESGVPGYIDEIGRVRLPPGAVGGGGTITPMTWGDALRATLALPGVSQPVQARVGVDNATISLVDGAVCDSSGIEAVIDAGGDVLLLSVPVRIDTPEAESFAGKDFVSVMRRASLMRQTRLSRLPLDAFMEWREGIDGETAVGDYLARLKVIDATIDLPFIDTLELDLGLCDIWRDYGYMRAFDVLAVERLMPGEDAPGRVDMLVARSEVATKLDESSAIITSLRAVAWQLEHAINGTRPGQIDTRARDFLQTAAEWEADMAECRRIKREIGERVRQRLQYVRSIYAAASTGRQWAGPAVPPEASRWSQGLERHWWAPNLLNANGVAPTSVFEAVTLQGSQLQPEGSRNPGPRVIGSVGAESPPAFDPAWLAP